MHLSKKSVVNPAPNSGIVHFFGMGEKHSSEMTISELLLLSIDKELKFYATEKGKETIQNFQCFAGSTPIRSRQEEGRVRATLTLIYKEIDKTSETVLSTKKPSIGEENVPMWNHNRNKVATMIQEKVIDTLSKIESDIEKNSKLTPPKRCPPAVSALMSRYDKVSTARHNQSKAQLTDSMLNFLGKTPSSSASSSSSSSSKKV